MIEEPESTPKTKKTITNKAKAATGDILVFPVKLMCTHLFGESHSFTHRTSVGVIVMVIGVLIAKVGVHYEAYIIHYGCDVIGYALHGFGCAPILDHVAKNLKDKDR